jgi:hypothetical protein
MMLTDACAPWLEFGPSWSDSNRVQPLGVLRRKWPVVRRSGKISTLPNGGSMKKLLILLFLLSPCLAESVSRSQLISGRQVGPVTEVSTRADIAAVVGSANMKEGEVYLGEGQTSPATIIYPDQPKKTMKIVWKPGPQVSATPESVWLEGKESEWHTPSGVSLGTGLSRLEKLNGVPFALLGFEWDLGGGVNSWGGNLEEEMRDVYVRLKLPENAHRLAGEEAIAEVLGDHEVSSSHPVFQKVDPVIDRIVVTF